MTVTKTSKQISSVPEEHGLTARKAQISEIHVRSMTPHYNYMGLVLGPPGKGKENTFKGCDTSNVKDMRSWNQVLNAS